MATKAVIRDGELGRGEAFGKDPIYLEVFAKVVITSPLCYCAAIVSLRRKSYDKWIIVPVVFIQGTVVTTYYEYQREIVERDSDGIITSVRVNVSASIILSVI
jgi:hypothetical protein